MAWPELSCCKAIQKIASGTAIFTDAQVQTLILALGVFCVNALRSQGLTQVAVCVGAVRLPPICASLWSMESLRRIKGQQGPL